VRNGWRGLGGRGHLISLFLEGRCVSYTYEVFLRWEPRCAWLKSDKVCPPWYENEILHQCVKISLIDRDTPTFCLAPIDPHRHRGGITRNYLLLFWFIFFLLFAWFYFCISFTRDRYICATIRCQKLAPSAIKVRSAILCLSVFERGKLNDSRRSQASFRTDDEIPRRIVRASFQLIHILFVHFSVHIFGGFWKGGGWDFDPVRSGRRRIEKSWRSRDIIIITMPGPGVTWFFSCWKSWPNLHRALLITSPGFRRRPTSSIQLWAIGISDSEMIRLGTWPMRNTTIPANLHGCSRVAIPHLCYEHVHEPMNFLLTTIFTESPLSSISSSFPVICQIVYLYVREVLLQILRITIDCPAGDSILNGAQHVPRNSRWMDISDQLIDKFNE
jgi:hypothetical protein